MIWIGKWLGGWDLHHVRNQLVIQAVIPTGNSLFKSKRKTPHDYFKFLARIFFHLKVDPTHWITDMKYLEAPTLSALSSKLNQVTESDMKLNCRIELYSCATTLPGITYRQDVNRTEATIEETASGLP